MNGKKIRELRRNMGLSQIDLAHLVGVDQGTVSRWERGKESPRPTNQAALQNALSAARKRVEPCRVRAFLEYDVVPSVKLDSTLKMVGYSKNAARHYLEKHGIELDKLKGTGLKEHAFRLGVPELWEAVNESGLLEGKVGFFRFVMNVNGRGHSTIYEPIFEDDEVAGFLGYISGTYEFPENRHVSVELIQAMPLGPDATLVTLFRGSYASVVEA